MITIPAALVFVLLPGGITLLFGGKAGGIKGKVIQVSAVAVASGLALLLAYLLLGSSVTVYEYLLVESIAAAAVTMFWVGIRDKDFSMTRVLKLVCLICMIVAVYSILTYGQTLIHGDTATASLLTKAQLKYGQFFPENWYYVNGDIWVISLQLFVAPFVVLLKDQSLARVLGSALLITVTAWVMYLHSKKAYGNESWVLAVPLLFVFLAGDRDMILYQAAYTLEMVYLIAGAVLAFRIYEGACKTRDYVLICIFLVASIVSGIRYVAEILLPLWLTCMVLNYLMMRNREQLDWMQAWKEWTRLTFAIFVPAVIGLVGYVYLNSTLNMIDTAKNSLALVSTLEDCMENVRHYVIGMFKCFGFRGGARLISLNGLWSMCSVIMCSIVVFVVPVLQARKIKQESAYVKFMFTFGMIHNLVMFTVTVFLEGKNLTRYLLTSVFVWILISARYIYVYWINQKHFEKIVWTGLFTIASILGCTVLGAHSVKWEKHLEEKMTVVSVLREKGLTKGYADFWEAYAYEIYSDFELRFGGLNTDEDDFSAHFWLTDGAVFTPEETNTFLLLTEEENQQYSPILSDKFEKPIDYFEFNGNHVYVYDYDIAVDMI